MMPDSQLIGILIAAMVAGVLLFRLYTVLGRRTGHEPQNDAALGNRAPSPLRDMRGAAAADVQVQPPEGACARGLLDIELADPAFDRDRFLSGGRTAYEIIQKAYGDADRLALRPLLSDEVFAAFEREIAARQNSQGAGAPDRMTNVIDARIVGAELSGKLADITIAFRANFTAPDGVVREVADRWSFARTIGAFDPNWTLVATAGDSA
jgi:predicted lipid-binding transport protein (Tim44 family)